MTKNTAKIRTGFIGLAGNQYEIVSGTVVAGSHDAEMNTVTVLPYNGGQAITGVLLSAISGSENGLIVVPAAGSDIVVASVEGQGQWVVILASEIERLTVKIGNTKCTVSDQNVKIEVANTILDIAEQVKINTASESLYAILHDTLTAISLLTVGTPSGPSTVPLNAATFSTIDARLSNLLAA